MFYAPLSLQLVYLHIQFNLLYDQSRSTDSVMHSIRSVIRTQALCNSDHGIPF